MEELELAKKSQIQVIIDKFKKTGSVTRNWALQHYISRLSAIIARLRDMGCIINARRGEQRNGNWDYIYEIVKFPKSLRKVD